MYIIFFSYVLQLASFFVLWTCMYFFPRLNIVACSKTAINQIVAITQKVAYTTLIYAFSVFFIHFYFSLPSTKYTRTLLIPFVCVCMFTVTKLQKFISIQFECSGSISIYNIIVLTTCNNVIIIKNGKKNMLEWRVFVQFLFVQEIM